MPQLAREKVLAKKLAPVKNQYDFILIDTPPYFGTMVVNAMVAADYVLMPVQPEPHCVSGLFALLERLEAVRDNISPNLALLGLFVTLYNKTRASHVQITESLYRDWPDHMFKTVLRLSARNDRAALEGRSLVSVSPRAELATDYRQLCEEVLVRVGR